MNKIIIFLLLSCSYCFSLLANDQNNDFYDNSPTYELQGNPIEVLGEIKNPGNINLSSLPLRSVIVKETKITGTGQKFIGAYRYDGYSLYDILNSKIIQKNNQNDFSQIIDLYVKIKNPYGQSTVVTWGEIFYPTNRHNIIIATKVSAILPKATNDQWPIPQKMKLVVASDIISERNIISPNKIIVKSANIDLENKKGITPLYSPEVKIYRDSHLIDKIDKNLFEFKDVIYPTVFYGRGKGIHGITDFTGIPLKNILKSYFPITEKTIREGLILISAIDGYRGIFSFSEIFNRNDQAEIILIYKGEDIDSGKFSLFTSADYFSDRAIKAISGIHFSRCEKFKLVKDNYNDYSFYDDQELL